MHLGEYINFNPVALRLSFHSLNFGVCATSQPDAYLLSGLPHHSASFASDESEFFLRVLTNNTRMLGFSVSIPCGK